MFSGQNEKPKGVKQAPTARAGAERRQRQMVSVRQRAHKELMKHIREDIPEEPYDTVSQVSDPTSVWSYSSKTRPEEVPVALLGEFVRMVTEGQTDREVFHGTLMIRKILSVEKSPPHEAVTQSGVIPYLVNLLDRENHELQFEAAWALTNIAAGASPNVTHLVDAGAVPRFVALLSSSHPDCRDQGAWAIGNMAGDGVTCRDVALRCNAMPALLNALSIPEQPVNIVRNIAWAISNLCRGKPSPNLEYLTPALPYLANMLHHPDQEVVTDASWAISYISDGPQERVQAVIEAGVVPRVVEFLMSSATPLQTSAIRTVGNIASGNDMQTQVIINCGVLGSLAPLLAHPKREIRKETCWTISNIAAGSAPQIEALIRADVFPLLLKCLESPELDVKKEAVWSVANVTLCGIPPHLHYLLNCGVIPPLCETLNTNEPKILTVALEAITGFLQLGEDNFKAGATTENTVARAIIECGGVNLIERMQSYTDKNVYNMALSILETYFNVEEDDPHGQDNMAMHMIDSSVIQGSGGFDF
ncbi:putative Armadillo beta catenin like repeat HEAT like repeat Atypical Arm repeat [Trypanosoma vivax]|uniref:Importin subunit alpha n=1 Tax=Trypanosoma vivax (strain Y486) TaxID=1055687 RepID=G0TWT5_TRYVY|nr:putative importin alpha [Trypanosoma vivax]KAH8614110.1 putative Armadillo beta catenin like repeat HEAT like repeat Atypical Arm repeat [Trypanosoma vivax]CCC48423.1 putative importin alpha [Trypanosoma vivax Y486]